MNYIRNRKPMLIKAQLCSLLLGSSFLTPSFAGAYSGGNGTSDTPFLISTRDDLLQLAANTSDYNKYFKLTTDLDLSDVSLEKALIAWDTDVDVGFQGTPFTGSFDGGNHTISNLTINATNTENWYLGFFGQMD